MTAKETVEKYFKAIHGGGWEDYIADDFTTIANNFDKEMDGRKTYLEYARSFFVMTTAVEIRQMLVEGDKAAVFARYTVRNPKGETSVCDVAELLTVKDGKLISSSIFFDTKPVDEFLARE